MGFLLTDSRFKPIFSNQAAARILGFPGELDEAGFQQRIRSILQVEEYRTRKPGQAAFPSGKRQYLCRPFLVEPPGQHDRLRQPTVAILLERSPGGPLAVWKATERYHLSRRESEAIRHLVQGLTTKEVAQRMQVSPNTVKQYVRIVMAKMSVTTRSGIVGKLLA